MKTLIWTSGAMLLITVNLFWIWKFDQNEKELQLQNLDDRNRLVQAAKECNRVKMIWEYSVKCANAQLPGKLHFSDSESGEIKLANKIGGSKKLVLVLSNRNCDSCVEQLLFTLKSDLPPTSLANMLVLYSTDSSRRPLWLNRIKILNGPVYMEIPDRGLGLPADSLDVPYFFVTGPELITSSTFLHFSSFENYTKDYLSMINQLHFKSQ